MTKRVQVQRILTTNQIPAPGSRDPGELWVNFADFQIGFINELKTAQKLLPVRFWSIDGEYFFNDVVIHNGGIYTAKGQIMPGAFDPSQWVQIGVGGSGGGAGGPFLPLLGGIMQGALGLFEDPIGPMEAATKRYVDNLVASGGGGGGGGGPYLLLSGGTMSGDITLPRDPISPLMAATKQYVDAHAGGGGGGAGYLPLAGGTMTGPIVLAADPASNLQAATKQYVDAHAGSVGGPTPAGVVVDYAGISAPTGWVMCDGSAYLQTDPLYVNLYAAIGTRYGTAPGGYFKVPPANGRVTVGVGSAFGLGNTGGAQTVTLSVAQLAQHKHVAGGHLHTSQPRSAPPRAHPGTPAPSASAPAQIRPSS